MKMPIADWPPYPPPLYINIGFGPSRLKIDNKNLKKMNWNKIDTLQAKCGSNSGSPSKQVKIVDCGLLTVPDTTAPDNPDKEEWLSCPILL